jgi:heptosyltransferase-2
VAIDRSTIKKILVRSTNWVGDVVMTLPALETVGECFPECHVSVLAKPWVAPLFEGHPVVDDVITYNKSNGVFSGIKDIFRLSSELKKQQFDLAILFQNAFEAALIVKLAGIQHRVGFNTDHRGFLLTDTVPMQFNFKRDHQIGYYQDILKHLGCQCEERDPELYISEKNRIKADELLKSIGIKEGETVLGLSPGAIFGPAKRWPPDRFASIGDLAEENWNAKVILFGSNKEKDICSKVSEQMKTRPFNLCGRTGLGEAIALIKRCNFFVTNDSGLMHVAGALKIPLVAIFGSTNPYATGPRGSQAVVIQHETDCSPCLKQECPTDFRCMLDVEADEVWTALQKLRNMSNHQNR